MPLRCAAARLFAALTLIALVALSGCAVGGDADSLSAAHKQLHRVPCGPTPAVCGVASVNANPHHAYVGDWIVVSVCHLDDLVKAAEASQTTLTLFVEGRDSGNEPAGIDVDTGTVTFILDRNDTNRDLWRPFLYDPLFDPEVSMRLSAGLRGERPLPRAPGANLTMQVKKIYVDWTTWLWVALLAAITVVIILCSARTDMLRDGPALDGVRQPFSLGRSQMAWWFFLSVISYAFIWLVTSDRDTLPPSLLGLMGISSATALIAVAIRKPNTVVRTSRGWWRDLVSDDRGVVALDRLQIVVWTVVLSGIFLSSVVWELTMPEFSPTLLTLMGISSGTYLGFQLPQKTNDTSAP